MQTCQFCHESGKILKCECQQCHSVQLLHVQCARQLNEAKMIKGMTAMFTDGGNMQDAIWGGHNGWCPQYLKEQRTAPDNLGVDITVLDRTEYVKTDKTTVLLTQKPTVGTPTLKKAGRPMKKKNHKVKKPTTITLTLKPEQKTEPELVSEQKMQ